MADFKHCLDGIVKASGGKMSKEEAFKSLADIEKLIQAAKANGYNINIAELGADNAAVMMKIEKQKLYKKLNAIESKIKLSQNINDIKDAVSVGWELPTAVERHAAKVKANIDQRVRMLDSKLLGFLDEGEVRDFFEKKLDPDVVSKYKSQLIDIDQATGQPLVRSGGLDLKKIPEQEKMAYRTALALAKMDDFYHTTMNRLGAPVGFLKGRIGKNAFNAASIGLKKEAFIADALKQWDWSKIYTGDFTPEQFLDTFADKVKSGVYGPLKTTDDIFNDVYEEMVGAAGTRGSNLAERLGKTRTIHILPEHWNEFSKKWGYGDIYDSTIRDVYQSARQMEMLQTYGANPQASFEQMLNTLRDENLKIGKAGNHPLDSKKIRNLYDVISGKAEQPIDGQLARIFDSARGFASVLHLPLAGITSISDIAVSPMYAAAKMGHKTVGAQVQGVLNEFGTTLQARTSGLSDQLSNSLYEGEIAMMNHFSSITTANRPIRDVMEVPTQVSEDTILNRSLNVIDAVHNKIFEYNPVKWWTDQGLKARMNAMAYQLGNLSDASKLATDTQKWLHEIGIDDLWDVMKTRKVTDEQGKTFIHINALDDITDAEVKAISGADLSAREIANARDAIVVRFKSAYMLDAENALAMPDVGFRAELAQWQRGTWGGEIARSVLQFKSYPISFVNRIIGPLLKSQKGVLATGMAINTMVSLLGNYLKDGVMGKTPRDYWGTSDQEGAVLRNWVGLATTVIGLPYIDEIIKKAFSEEGFRAGDTASFLGPVIGDAAKTLENTLRASGALIEGDTDKAVSKILPTVTSAPIIGPMLQGTLLKGAIKNIFLDNVNEMFNPGYKDNQAKIAELQGSRIMGR